MSEPEAISESGGVPRLQHPERRQMGWQMGCLDDLLSPEHRARAIWDFVEGLDLSAFYRGIKAVEGHAGRPPIDPKILITLWLYATVEGVGSARALERLCEQHDAYRWILGGVGINHHTLSDFRVEAGAALDGLLTQSVAALMNEGVVRLRRVAQDGVRVRASAGAGSYRSEQGLAECLKAAREQVETLRKELEKDPAASTRRQAAAREHAKSDRLARVRRALKKQEQLAEAAAGQRKKQRKDRDPKGGGGPRVSTTDPEARVMKMGDGGYRPAYNAQFATDTKSQVIVGVDVTTVSSDSGGMTPMAQQIFRRYRRRPKEWLADGGYCSVADIEAMEAAHHEVYVPTPKPRPRSDTRDQRVGKDLAGIRRWRRRMARARTPAIYRERGAAAECVNAIARNRGLQRFLVRGREKVRTVLLWFAVTHNAMRTWAARGRRLALT